MAFVPTLPATAWAGHVACSASATPLVFGAYAASNTHSLDFTTTVRVTCTPQGAGFVSYRVMLSAGGGSSYGTRAMQGRGAIAYQLFANAAHALVWGDGTAGTVAPGAAYALAQHSPPRTDSFTVYGRLVPGQGAAIGGYSDSITVVVLYGDGDQQVSR